MIGIAIFYFRGKVLFSFSNYINYVGNISCTSIIENVDGLIIKVDMIRMHFLPVLALYQRFIIFA
jgi:hypothetical protein